MNFEILNVISSSTLTAIGSVFAAVISTVLGYLFSKQQDLEKRKIIELQKAINTKSDHSNEMKSEAIANAISSTPGSMDEIKNAVRQSLRESVDALKLNNNESDDFVTDLVNSYHSQALSQARFQFWFSVTAATIGFAYIIYASNKAYTNGSEIFFNILPGTIIDAVAVLFFKQAEQTRERATALYDRLRQDNQLETTRILVDSIEDEKIRSLVKAQIALHKSGINPKQIDLQNSP